MTKIEYFGINKNVQDVFYSPSCISLQFCKFCLIVFCSSTLYLSKQFELCNNSQIMAQKREYMLFVVVVAFFCLYGKLDQKILLQKLVFQVFLSTSLCNNKYTPGNKLHYIDLVPERKKNNTNNTITYSTFHSII